MNNICTPPESPDISRSSKRDVSLFLGILICLVLLDQASKLWAISALQNAPAISWAGDFFRIVYAENPGAFLSLGSQLPEAVRFLVMIVFNAIVLLVLSVYLWKKWEMPRVQRTILGVILAGGIGNLIDRICYQGVVIDFLNIGIGTLRSGIFNLADVWITAGVLGLFCLGFIQPNDNWKQSVQDKESAVNPTSIASLILIIGTCLLLLPVSNLIADSVVYRAGKRGGRVAISGEIIDFNSQKMTFRVKSPDTIQELQQSQILAFNALYMKSHQKTIQKIRSGDYEAASQSVKNALNTEARPWVRRELMSLAVQCAINLEHWSTAATHYLAMKASDPKTRNLDLIPLHWRPVELSDIDRDYAMRDIASSNDTARLIAASWLLQSTESQQRAVAVLNELLYAPETDVRNLARCQLWRVKLANGNINDGDLVGWERQLRNLPDGYWAGPMFLLAQGYQKRVQPDLAAARYLWLTVLDSRNVGLVREATLNAAQILESLGQKKSGDRLRNEAELRFPPRQSP
ncbi:MAG: signal peptidase II [Planctomycetaceae bacterium]|nr:signal peptidase II [Planctomycetaceae bacterium]